MRLLLPPASVTHPESYLKRGPVWVLSFPEAVYDVNLDSRPHIFVEMAHQEVDIVEIVELPTFQYQGVAQQVLQRYRPEITLGWQTTNRGQVKRGGYQHPLFPFVGLLPLLPRRLLPRRWTDGPIKRSCRSTSGSGGSTNS